MMTVEVLTLPHKLYDWVNKEIFCLVKRNKDFKEGCEGNGIRDTSRMVYRFT